MAIEEQIVYEETNAGEGIGIDKLCSKGPSGKLFQARRSKTLESITLVACHLKFRPFSD